jgi:RNA recognition motif-containing protein
MDHHAASNALKKLKNEHNLYLNKSLTINWSTNSHKSFNQIEVDNLDERVTFEQLFKIFSKFGPLERIIHIRDRAYIGYVNAFDAFLAREQLNSKSLNGQEIQVKPCYVDKLSSSSSSSQLLAPSTSKHVFSTADPADGSVYKQQAWSDVGPSTTMKSTIFGAADMKRTFDSLNNQSGSGSIERSSIYNFSSNKNQIVTRNCPQFRFKKSRLD